MSKLTYLIQGSNIIISHNGNVTTLTTSHPSYTEILKCLRENKTDKIPELLDVTTSLINYGNGKITIKGGVVYFDKVQMNGAMADRLLDMSARGFPVGPMVAFMENIMNNPSNRSVTQLYEFLEKNNLPITEDGHFLAFKKVRKDFTDIHSGKMDNSPGKIVSMPRNQVDDDPTRTCSHGLHFCSVDYLNHFGSSTDPVIVVKVNPMNVCAIPQDYQCTKARCCEYEVLYQVEGNPHDAFTKSHVIVDKKGNPVTVSKDKVEKPKAGKKKATQQIAPFPTGNKKSTQKLYTLARCSDGTTVYTGLTLGEANAMIEKHQRNKKCKLRMV